MLAFAVPVALVLFLLFPRVPGPFWALPARGNAGITGLSDEMSPGTISQLIHSDEVVFRVAFDGPDPAARRAILARPRAGALRRLDLARLRSPAAP
jgi:protein-glutamine gamma-glutamyltransferase